MYGQPNRLGMDPNKFVTQMIVQAIQAFYNQDYETGVHFIEQIRSNLPSFLYNLNPTLRNLCKDIVKLVQGGTLVQQHSLTEQPSAINQDSNTTTSPISAPVLDQPDLSSSNEHNATPAAFISELSQKVKEKKESKKKKIEDELKGSISDLEDFDF